MPTIVTKIERRKGIRVMAMPSKDTFKGYTVDSKLDTLYDFHIEAIGLLERTCSRVDVVEKNQGKWKLVTASVGAGTGIVGGAFAMFAKLKWWG